jgi:hypothetical protein
MMPNGHVQTADVPSSKNNNNNNHNNNNNDDNNDDEEQGWLSGIALR